MSTVVNRGLSKKRAATRTVWWLNRMWYAHVILPWYASESSYGRVSCIG